MNVTITAKLKLSLNEEQQQLLTLTGRAYRNGCNFVSERAFLDRDFKSHSVHDKCYTELRKHFGLKSQMAESVIKTVMSKYKTNASNGHSLSLVAFRQPQVDLVWNRDYSLNADVFSLNTLDGRIKTPFESKGMESFFDGTWRLGTAKIVHKHKKWFLHIPMTKDIPQLDDTAVTTVVGADLGINFLATTYDTEGKTAFVNGRTIKEKRAHYKEIRKQLQQKQTPSARRRLKAIGQRENRWMTDVNHSASKALIDHYGAGTLFVLEDLTGIRSATEKVRTPARYVTVSWAFYQFRQMLEYKANLHGAKVMAVDPKYTSQTCPKCEHTHKQNRNKKIHLFRCRQCGYTSNDDRIGAMNLYGKGIKYLTQGA